MRDLATAVLLVGFCPLAYGLGALISWLSPLPDDPLQVEDDR